MLFISIFLIVSPTLSQVFPEDFKDKAPSSTVPGGKKAANVLQSDFEFAFDKNPAQAQNALTKRSSVGTRSPDFKLDNVFSDAQKTIFTSNLEKRAVVDIGESGLDILEGAQRHVSVRKRMMTNDGGVSGKRDPKKNGVEITRRIAMKHSIERRSLTPSFSKDTGLLGEFTTPNSRDEKILTDEGGDKYDYAGKHIWIRKRSAAGDFAQLIKLQHQQQQDDKKVLGESHITRRSFSPSSTANGDTIIIGNSRQSDQLNGKPSDQAGKHVSVRKRSFDPTRRILIEVANKHATFKRSIDAEGPKSGTIGRVKGVEKRSLKKSKHDYSGRHASSIRKRTFDRDDFRDRILTADRDRDLEKEIEMSDLRSRIHQLS